jgi:hypothetical protein
MTDEPRSGEPAEGEYTDSELPLSAELPKEEYEEVAEQIEAGDDEDLGDDPADTAEMDIDAVDIVETDTGYPPDRDTL